MTLIKASLFERFIVVYSSEICDAALDNIGEYHLSHGRLATLVQARGDKNRLCAVVAESELLDYVEQGKSFEKRSLLRVAEDGEIALYNLVYQK